MDETKRQKYEKLRQGVLDDLDKALEKSKELSDCFSNKENNVVLLEAHAELLRAKKKFLKV